MLSKYFSASFRAFIFYEMLQNYFYLKYPHPHQLKAMVMFMVFNATFNNILSYGVGLKVMWLFPNQPIDTRTLYIQLYNLHDKHIHTLFLMKWFQTFISYVQWFHLISLVSIFVDKRIVRCSLTFQCVVFDTFDAYPLLYELLHSVWHSPRHQFPPPAHHPTASVFLM